MEHVLAVSCSNAGQSSQDRSPVANSESAPIFCFLLPYHQQFLLLDLLLLPSLRFNSSAFITKTMSGHRDGAVWQSDEEVSSCFLCHSKYTFFNRRHHCRKCGRVVCGNCSDQQIEYFPNTSVVGPGNHHSRLDLFETYRTCDECVEEIIMIRRALFGNPSSASLENTESRRSSISDSGDNVDNDNDSTTKYSTRTSTRLMQSSTDSSLVLDDSSRRGRKRHHHHSRSHRDEESDSNLCPVCAINLLKQYIDQAKKTNAADISHDDFEQFKESHINDCLTSFDFNPDTQRLSPPQAVGAKSHTRNKMLVYNIPPIPKPKFETIPNVEGASYDTIRQFGEGQLSYIDDEILSLVNSSHTIQEKLAEDVDNECVICLEELKPGDKVGRLECLCVFHYKCIKDWFNKKGYGECPIHFIHQ